ncbi:Heat shock cognate protein [Echinococcus granulosus]|uniref:Heat shock cognate protein n=1 Tax=Echinococcus granulosus TaxID=6210 RepID=W6UBQ3_ECHGR|nr:Heat shock cognate protein [Echinococcus granulosus]EUB58828.1 Heat shock cognate protein [Echinococcus granulosus]
MSIRPAIGIDLRTTFACVGVFQNYRVEIIANDQGNRIMPSCVAFTNKERLVGESAINQAAMNPTNTVFNVKRLIGRCFDDGVVQSDMKHWPFKVINSQGKPKVEVQHCGETKQFVAEQISAMVLAKMKETAEMYLSEKVTDAVITVPAYFNVSQRQATIDAAKIAGLKVLRLINEPTAAAIAYGMDRRSDGQRNVLVFDWGGGTFDVSILFFENGKLEVKAVGGDTHLGGEDITSRLVDHCVEKFKQEHEDKDLSISMKTMGCLREACEKAKRMLSSAEYTDVGIVSLFEDVDFSTTLTRGVFEQLCLDLFSQTMDAVKTALSDAKMDKADIHEILLVGGSTRIPKVHRMLQDFFNGGEVKRSINPDEAVVNGAAALAAKLSGMSNSMQDLMLLEVTPLSLGYWNADGTMVTVIKRNTRIPTKQTCKSYASIDNQKYSCTRIYEGERAKAKDNHFLGEFRIEGLPAVPRGKIKFKKTFEIDENGILHVSTVEMSTGKQNSITIANYRGRLSEEETERMLAEAEKFKQEDEKERSRVAALNLLVDCIYSMKRKLEKEEIKQKISEEYRQTLLAKCEEMIKRTDTEKQATKEEYETMLKKFESACSL